MEMSTWLITLFLLLAIARALGMRVTIRFDVNQWLRDRRRYRRASKELPTFPDGTVVFSFSGNRPGEEVFHFSDGQIIGVITLPNGYRSFIVDGRQVWKKKNPEYAPYIEAVEEMLETEDPGQPPSLPKSPPEESVDEPAGE
ncbi:hypothetical protein [Candidatus Palauibacter sp.]|uniref:hypothetical protein n=1 Tax=Candidatus Palauibacter sp. TaxID=3101350 RepID=UPI003AF28C7A